MPSKLIHLSKPIELFGKRLTELELREPSGGDYLRNGDPRILVFNASGSGYWVEQNETIRAYLEKCLVSDLGTDIVNHLTLDDVMEVKAQLFDFFSDAANRRSATKSTASSSASG
jgi:hypothetical protein